MARRRGGPVNDPRTDARERTLLMLYEAETKGISPREVLDAQVIRPDEHTVDARHRCRRAASPTSTR